MRRKTSKMWKVFCHFLSSDPKELFNYKNASRFYSRESIDLRIKFVNACINSDKNRAHECMSKMVWINQENNFDYQYNLIRDIIKKLNISNKSKRFSDKKK